ncbi:MAG: hypothetical protein Q9213_004614 [Squamulea squamosa]
MAGEEILLACLDARSWLMYSFGHASSSPGEIFWLGIDRAAYQRQLVFSHFAKCLVLWKNIKENLRDAYGNVIRLARHPMRVEQASKSIQECKRDRLPFDIVDDIR